MTSKDELRDLRAIGEIEEQAKAYMFEREKIEKFEAELLEVSEKLDMRLRVAARKGYLELKLITVDSPELVDLAEIRCIDHNQRSTRGGGWVTVNPYQSRSVVRNAALLVLWDRLEAMSLRPIFIEGPYGAPVFGVQLPDGKAYPRDDKAKDVAARTITRMDFCLNENGGISFTP